jgi:hypothetical protein
MLSNNSLLGAGSSPQNGSLLLMTMESELLFMTGQLLTYTEQRAVMSLIVSSMYTTGLTLLK